MSDYAMSPPQGPAASMPGPPRTSGAAVASLVLGILGCIPFVTSLLALILSVVGLRATRYPGVGGRGMAIAGLVLGILGLVGWAVGFGGVYTLFMVSKPAHEEATAFTKDLAEGRIEAAHARCTEDISLDDLRRLAESFKPLGALEDLTRMAVEAKAMAGTGSDTTWELTCLGTFRNQKRTVSYVMVKVGDSFRVAGVQLR